MAVKWLWLTLALAIAFNALLPFFAVHNPSIGNKSHLSSVLGERLLICTGDGFKWVKLADLQSGKEKPKPHSGDQCPLCSAVRDAGKAIVAAWSVPAPDDRVPAPVSARYDPIFIALYRTSPLTVRAPPVSFIG